MKKISIVLIILCSSLSLFAADSLFVHGRVMLDTTGLADVEIGPVVTDSSGYYAFKLPKGIDTTFTPHLNAFLFDPADLQISALDTLLDSMNFCASRQVKKVIVISGQSNAEHVGAPDKYFISDTVDKKIPYYLAYCAGEFGLSTLGLLTQFGYSYEFCKNYNYGFGFEMLLARTLYKHYTDSLAVFKAPWSGTSLYEDWQPEGATWQWFLEQHDQAVNDFHDFGYEPEYIGFFWFQGESDETAQGSSSYAENLHTFVDRIRERFPNSSEVDSLPFICVQINWDHTSDYEAPVRAAQMDLHNWREFTSCIDVDDCNSFRYSSHNMHFSGTALNRIGYRLAVEYLDMVGQPIDSNITVCVDLKMPVDTTVIFRVEGDTSFTAAFDSMDFVFPAKLGDSLFVTLDLDSDNYTYVPESRLIPYAYDASALIDPSYTFVVEKVVAVADYPDNMDHVLMDCYPNPFNPRATLHFQLPGKSDVELGIYNLLGRKIATLVDMSMEQGAYKIEWDASDIPSGIYIAKLQAGGETVIQKLTLLK